MRQPLLYIGLFTASFVVTWFAAGSTGQSLAVAVEAVPGQVLPAPLPDLSPSTGTSAPFPGAPDAAGDEPPEQPMSVAELNELAAHEDPDTRVEAQVALSLLAEESASN